MAPLIVHPVLVNAVLLPTPTSPVAVDVVQVTAGPPRMVKLDAPNMVSATTEPVPVIPVPAGAKPATSAATINGPYHFAARPFEFFMMVPSSGTVEPVSLLERQTSQLATHGMFLCEAIPLQSTTVRLTRGAIAATVP